MKKIPLLMALILALGMFVPVLAAETEFYFTNIYEDFESYVTPDDTIQTTDGPYLKNKQMTGGTGWNGAWYDNANGTITGSHKLVKAYYEKGSVEGIDLYSTTLTTNQLKRRFATPVDFTKEGKYVITVNARPDTHQDSGNKPYHDLLFVLGDKIAFGIKIY